MTYHRRHSASSGSNWSPAPNLQWGTTHRILQAPSLNHRMAQSALSTAKISKTSWASPAHASSSPTSDRSRLYQTTSTSVTPPTPVQSSTTEDPLKPTSSGSTPREDCPTSHGSTLTAGSKPPSGVGPKTITRSSSLSHRMMNSSISMAKLRKPHSPTLGQVAGPIPERPLLHQSTSKAMMTPSTSSTRVILGDPNNRSSPDSNSRQESRHETYQQPIEYQGKGKEPLVVRTRPIFHANLEEAKKYHQNQLKSPSPKKITISTEEVISRYCDHFKFQLPTLEVDRSKETGKKKVFLTIKRRLLGIGEGRTTFEAMLAAYDDTVLYLFKGDVALKSQLMKSNETIEWNHAKVGKT